MIRCTLIFVLLVRIGFLSGQDFMETNISLHVKDMQIKDVLDQISERNGVYFTYAGNLKVMDKKISLNIDKVNLKALLTDLFFGEDIVFTCFSNQVILKRKPEPAKHFGIRGIVLASGTEQPVEFASLVFKHSGRGTVAGGDGKFEFTAKADESGDSISFHCMGYETRSLSIRYLSSLEFHKIYLTPRPIELEVVEHKAKKAKIHKEGNRGVALGSLYLDTHGQQVALYIGNREGMSGRIKTVSFFLSGKGNTEAPFRIRIYGLRDSSRCPGMELLPDILVVKPGEGRGWFKVDVSRYNIRMPRNGMFIAMEGIYPGDYIQYLQSMQETNENEALENKDDFPEGSLEYGQRIGYNRFNKNETWHYSVSGSWFQLNKKNFNVMISAEILVLDRHKTKNKKP